MNNDADFSEWPNQLVITGKFAVLVTTFTMLATGIRGCIMFVHDIHWLVHKLI